MSRMLAATVLLLSASTVQALTARPRTTQPRTTQPATSPAALRAQFDAVLAGLRANADRWYRDQEIEFGPEVALKNIYFDEAAIPLLVAALQTVPIDANGLYVANRLLRQLSFAETPSIRAALPAVKALHARAKNTYRPLPHYSDVQLVGLRKPTSDNPKALADWEARIHRKQELDRAVAKYSEMVSVLERRTYQLMLQAQEIEEDALLTQALLDAEKDKSFLFLTLVELLAADARKMSQERAAKIYEFLRPPALELKMENRRSYEDKGKAVLQDEANSSFETVQAYPGIRLLSMLNRVSTAARAPAMKVPTDKEVARYQADKNRPTTPTKKRRDRGT